MPREVLLKELRVLGKRKLRHTLAEFTPAERETILTLINGRPQHSEDVRTPFSALVGLSPWLLKAVDRAERDDAHNSSLTMATRTALRQAVQEATKRRPEHSSSAPKTRGGLMRMFERHLRRNNV